MSSYISALTSFPAAGLYALTSLASLIGSQVCFSQVKKANTVFSDCCPWPLDGPEKGSWNFTVGPCYRTFVNLTQRDAYCNDWPATGGWIAAGSILIFGASILFMTSAAVCIFRCGRKWKVMRAPASEVSPAVSDERQPFAPSRQSRSASHESDRQPLVPGGASRPNDNYKPNEDA